MFRLTLGKVKSAVANAINMDCDDTRVADYVNRAQERLLYRMKSTQTVMRFRVCVTNDCIVWPRQIETIETFSVCNSPYPVRNQWYEFLGSGPGIQDSDCACGDQLIDRGDVASFDNVTGSASTLAISCDETETTTTKVQLYFYDNNGNWVRTQEAGVWVDGEYVSLPAVGYSYTTHQCKVGGFVRIIKPVTNSVIRLWEYDTVTTLYRALGVYESDEEIPVYRSSFVPGLVDSDAEGDCTAQTVIVMAKLRHIPVTNDTDYLIIAHTDAIRLAAQAIRFEENSLPEEATKYWGLAFSCLDDQKHHWNGDGVEAPLKFTNTNIWGYGGVVNVQ